MRIERTRLIRRGGGHRDARLFVIATEGKETERQYFAALKSQDLIDRRRVTVRVLPGDSASSPSHVMARLDEFHSGHRLHSSLDQLWLVLDLDHWDKPGHIHNFTRVAQEARAKGYFVAVSNPCFELWLLLHFTDDIADIRAISSTSEACEACRREIRRLCGSYDGASLREERYTSRRVDDAVERAEALEGAPEDRWPQQVGTRVHRLVRELVDSARRNPGVRR